ncbi:MAG: AmmeMemoRadiSam system protein B [Gemmatimonadota bacterium]|nr:AmmeMemoRadiSam system protein B [Gemmatimonadota bacterium]
MDNTQAVRSPAVAGQFYPANPQLLREEVISYLDKVEIDRSERDILALIAPHAGYTYSGPVAACAYCQVRGKSYETVVVISPSHRVPFGFSSVFSGKGYETPLGEVPVDREVVQALGALSNPDVRLGEHGHLDSMEHSLEVQLPFLQVVLDQFMLVPVVMGAQNASSSAALGQALAGVLEDRRALIVASSDLSHFHDRKLAQGLDERIVECIDEFDPQRLLQEVSSRNCEACGSGPMAAAMIAARQLGAEAGENLCYATSGDVSGDFSQVVGYTAGIFFK